MSRYELQTRRGSGASLASIGWDRPLQTYFVQVHRVEDDEEIAFIKQGTVFQELPNPADALRLIEPYCDAPDDLAKRLEIDRLQTLADGDGPAQIAAKNFISRAPRR
ncbi:hypothetical protein [Novosphingobium sp. KN65.2]|uniref:hypothetical protein n=1 Tax=Novosphingobium sp. KN65.2 TaxID=1478134 RepID=UPI0006D592CD|nr:hypothetical protein [Novosphingobium sp. KN65.2]